MRSNSGINQLHDDELAIDLALVQKMVASQFPAYASMLLRLLDASGSTNVLFRLGDELIVRLPRQPGSGKGIAKERTWMPMVSGQLPVKVPNIIAVGEPEFGYSEHWAIVNWLEGEHPQTWGVDDPFNPECAGLAIDLADVILALRAIEIPPAAQSDLALQAYRGRSLTRFDKVMRYNLDQCGEIAGLDLDLNAAWAVWEAALKLPGAGEAGSIRWYHSDLVAENLLMVDARLNAVLDFGGLGIGDPTIDLHGAWELLDPPGREIFRGRLGVDDAEWLRGRAWALAIALGTFTYYWDSMPGRIADRLSMARAVLADARA